MDKNNMETNGKSDDKESEDFCIDLRQFLHISLDKEKLKDELDGISNYNNIYEERII
ncbi:MAG: hypothetical protein ACI4EA_09555 [Candidatus Ornithomonoglobus sp.]